MRLPAFRVRACFSRRAMARGSSGAFASRETDRRTLNARSDHARASERVARCSRAMASVPNRRQTSNAVAAERSERGQRASTSGARRGGTDPALGVEPKTAVESSNATASAPVDGPKSAGEVASPPPAVDAIGDGKEMDDSTYDDEAEGEDKAGDATEEEDEEGYLSDLFTRVSLHRVGTPRQVKLGPEQKTPFHTGNTFPYCTFLRPA